MKNIIKSQKGAITLFVLVSMLFMTMFLMTIFTLSTNNEIASRNATKALKEEYEVGLDKIDEVYNSLLNVRAFDENGDEIENIEGWNIVYSSTTKGFRVEYTGNIKPYYIIAGEKGTKDITEGKITEYLTVLGTYEKENEDGTIVEITKKQLMLEGAEIAKSSAIKTIIGEIETDTEIVTDFAIGENTKLTTTSMKEMFYNLSNLENIDLNDLDTSNVSYMYQTFYGCKSLQEINLTQLDTSSVSNMYGMFRFCSNLTKIIGLDETNLNSNFITNNVLNMSFMFQDCNALTELNLDNFNTAKVTQMESMFANCKELKELDVSGFDMSNVTNAYRMFYYCEGLTSLKLGTFDTSGGAEDKKVSMLAMFCGCKELLEVDVSKFNTSKVTNMGDLFRNCFKLTKIIGLGEEDLNSNFVTDNVTNMSMIFSYCYALKELNVTGFSTSNVKSMHCMFKECQELERIKGLDNDNLNTKFITNIVTDMNNMFYGCRLLKELNLSTFDTSGVTNAMNYMFYNCKTLTTLDVSNFDISNVPSILGMFSHCSGLTTLDLSNFDTDGVTDMSVLFNYCSKLTEITLGEKFTISAETNITDMFKASTKLTNVYVKNKDAYNILVNSTITGANTSIFVDQST